MGKSCGDVFVGSPFRQLLADGYRVLKRVVRTPAERICLEFFKKSSAVDSE
jgi:hypothetical protein